MTTFVMVEGRVWRVVGVRRSARGTTRTLIRRDDRSALVEARRAAQ